MAEYWDILGLGKAPKTLKQANDAFSARYKKLRERGDVQGVEELQNAYDVAVSVLTFSQEVKSRKQKAKFDDDVSLDAFMPESAPEPEPEPEPEPALAPRPPRNTYVPTPQSQSEYTAQSYEAMGYSHQTRQLGFGEAIAMFYTRYFDFSLRSSRAEYWYVMLFIMLVTIGAIVVMMPSLVEYDEAVDSMPTSAVLIISLLILFYMFNAIPSLALNVRRLHDLGQSGWIYLLYCFVVMIPFIGFFAAIGWLVAMCLRGTIGHNQYGADPLALKR